MAMPDVGDQAPDFELPDQHGQQVRLSDLRGETLVLYFYPRADTQRRKGSISLRSVA